MDKEKDENADKPRAEIGNLKAQQSEIEGLMADLRKTRETAWKNAGAGLDRVRTALRESIRAARTSFN